MAQNLFEFDEAMKRLDLGQRVRRASWNAEKICLEVIDGNTFLKTTELQVDNPKARRLWLFRESDMFARDWMVVAY